MYSQTGRPSIAPEHLIRALLLQVLYTIRSEQLLVEQLEYNLLFRWFVGLSVDEPAWDHSTFSKNRDRLLEADIARELFRIIVEQARTSGLLSDEHFSVDGTMIDAWASQKSFCPKNGSDDPPSGGGRNATRDFHGEQRLNDTYDSTTDPETKLYGKSKGTPAKLCFLGHAVSENRHGLLVDACVTEANGTSERSAAIEMLQDLAGPVRCTVGADKAYDTRDFAAGIREINMTPQGLVLGADMPRVGMGCQRFNTLTFDRQHQTAAVIQKRCTSIHMAEQITQVTHVPLKLSES